MVLKSAQHLSKIKNLKSQRRGMASPGERVIGSFFARRGSTWPGGWSQDRYEQVMHFKNWTYVAVNVICSKIASLLPNMAYQVEEHRPGLTVKANQRGLLNLIGEDDRGNKFNFGGTPTITGFGGSSDSYLTMGEYRSKALSVVKPHDILEPLEMNHPLRRLFENPNPVDTSFDLLYELQMFEELTGVSYLWVVPNQFGEPCEMWVIPSHWVWPRTGGAKYVDPAHPYADQLIEYYEIRPLGGVSVGGSLLFPPDEVIMTRWKSPINKIDGYSRLGATAQWIDSEESISNSRWAQFQNQARPEFWLELGPGYEDPDDDKIARIEAKLMNKLQGEFNVGKPIITPPGARVTPLSFSPTEMSYFQSEEQIRDMILATFGVPKTAVGIVGDMTYGSLLASLAQLCSNCINPRLVMRGLTLTKHLGSRWNTKNKKVKIFFDDCLDEETECLTSSGWRKHTDLDLETEIACYDETIDGIVYHKPEKVIRRQHNDLVHVWEGDRINAVMTPNHRIYVKPKQKPDRAPPQWGFRTADELAPTQDYHIKRSARVQTQNAKPITIQAYEGGHQQTPNGTITIQPKEWAEFLGYYLSEGCLQRTHGENGGSWMVYVCQATDSRSYSIMEKCVTSMPGNWKQYLKSAGEPRKEKHMQFVCTNRGLYEHLFLHCGKGSQNLRIPAYAKAWDADTLRILLDAMIAGDGSKPVINPNTGVWNSQYTTTSKQLADDVQEIAIKCGLSASISAYPPFKEHQSPYYKIPMSSRTEVMVLPSHRTTAMYNGMVWCLRVPTGKFVVRRKGKVHITGNCIPADPGQVNSDLAEDRAQHAITPNEVRALRGRKPYRHGGNDPMGSMGVIPIPLNTGQDLEELSRLIKPMKGEGNAEGEDQGQSDLLGALGLGNNALPANDPTLDNPSTNTTSSTNNPNTGEATPKEAKENYIPGVKEPNSKPKLV